MTLSNHEREVTWDVNNKKQIEDAKKIYQQAKKEKRKITTLDNKDIDYFRPEYGGFLIKKPLLTESQFEMNILDDSGDTLLTFDSKDPLEVQEAATKFNELLKKGYRAYSISLDGEKKRRIYRFDPKAEEIYFDEKTLKQKLKEFVKSFKDIKMTSPTRKG